MCAAVAFGAPDVYRATDELRRTLGTVRMDVCAFAGVAPRGPARRPVEPDGANPDEVFVERWRERRSVAVTVESWDEYLGVFGGYEGPGRLPYAVAAFFEQGGARAHVVRIVHDYGNTDDDLDAVAELALGGFAEGTVDVVLRARSEGSWGNRLRAALAFVTTPLELLERPIDWPLGDAMSSALGTPAGTPFVAADSTRVVLPSPQGVVPGALLRLQGEGFEERRFVARVQRAGAPDRAEQQWYASLAGARLPGPATRAEVVTAACMILDTASGATEHFTALGLSGSHPRGLAAVLYRESRLVEPREGWSDAELLPRRLDAARGDLRTRLDEAAARFTGGRDRYPDIVSEDFFDPARLPADREPGSGVHAFAALDDVAMLVTPDLYVPEPLIEPPPAIDDEPPSGAEFAPCVDAAPRAVEPDEIVAPLTGLALDPRQPAERARIVELQRRLVAIAEARREHIVMLDVPPALHEREVAEWRVAFSSPYAAAYHPWVKVATLDDARDAAILLNPSAVAAGIVADRERRFGIPHGAANVIAREIVAVDERVERPAHDRLHPAGINVFRQERDGVRLTGARTLSREPSLRQLSVVRLMVMLRRLLWRQMQWVTFEPNGAALRDEVRFALDALLGQLYAGGAFRGANASEAFFVRCDAGLNDRRALDAGRLIVEIGVAPAEPLEFIVVRITRDADGTLAMEG